MIFGRLNGSVTPLRLTTASTASSTVVNRLPHSGHERRRRINAPSSASRESTTRESAWRQYGQRTANSPPEPPNGHLRACQGTTPRMSLTAHRRVDGRWRDRGSNPNQWMTYTLVTTRCWGRRYAAADAGASSEACRRAVISDSTRAVYRRSPNAVIAPNEARSKLGPVADHNLQD